MNRTAVILLITSVLIGAVLFWSWIFSLPTKQATERSSSRVTKTTEMSSITDSSPITPRVPGVPANTIDEARKVAGDLFNASFAYEHGVGVEKDHLKAVVLKSRSDAIYDLIYEIQNQPVTGRPDDAAKKIPSLKALRQIAKLDE